MILQCIINYHEPLNVQLDNLKISLSNFYLSKPRLQGPELRLQQHFRWVTLRWDQEPLHGLLGRHLRRKLLQKVSDAQNHN